ncbi:YihY/virulence factor BrkB family protein [Isoptericola dokdonensis]|uniref:Ribonuclease BN-like family protein n=1 Tax=Isoptericola dokdonensis DS-3 TaxID=1300344 RepID=A0A161IH02_9MICO|nr:YhjD/YihY/BrkB family envelope integrity protein [Isoptericola dokdonensis]ANC30894.1 Ribonuclease BN-like family protein [Isoptericola dokdonensis DS-3]
MPERIERLRSLAARATNWAKDRREVRSVQWYLARRGSQLSGGIAYSALFSLGAALTIGFSVFSSELSRRPELQAAIYEQIDTWLPGLLDTGSGDGLVPVSTLVVETAWSLTTAIAAVVFLWTAISFMGALRHSVRFMFDAPVVGVSPVLSKVWQLVGFAILGAMLVVSAAASVVSRTVTEQIEAWFGESWTLGVVLAASTFGVAVLLDALLVYLVIRVVARIRPRRRRDALLGCLATGLVTGSLRWVGTAVVTASASNSALLVPFVTLAAILLLINFVARVLLVACAWMYDPPRLDEIARAEAELVEMRRRAEVERIVRQGRGSGRPYSPVVRGVRRALYAY